MEFDTSLFRYFNFLRHQLVAQLIFRATMAHGMGSVRAPDNKCQAMLHCLTQCCIKLMHQCLTIVHRLLQIF